MDEWMNANRGIKRFAFNFFLFIFDKYGNYNYRNRVGLVLIFFTLVSVLMHLLDIKRY